jgi:peptidoglycan/LPS O-acetylase OafA/YrhL
MPVELAQKGSVTKHQPALDGIRGYGFLAVFLGHYLLPIIDLHRGNPLMDALHNLLEIAWLGVPAFFVLSGYLIGGILFETRGREGFFKVFYARRILRIFPLFYITLLAVALIDHAQGVNIKPQFWANVLYIQNLLPGYTSLGHTAPFSRVVHLWTLAVEEQFYLTWPIVVWLVKDRKTLLKIVAILVAASCALRLISPWIHLSARRCYVLTPTRADSILLGVGLALMGGHWIVERIRPYASYTALGGAVIFLISSWTHSTVSWTYLRTAFETPLANVVAVAMLIAMLDEKSTFAKLCRARWACWLGKMSYALYLLHYLYQNWLLFTVRPWLQAYMSEFWATVLATTLGFVLTVALAMFSFRFIESPAANLKKYFKYGPALKPRTSEASGRIAARVRVEA